MRRKLAKILLLAIFEFGAVTTAQSQSVPAASIFIVDSVRGGFDSSLQLSGANLVVSYWGDYNLKVATCTAGCGTASATWVVSAVDPIGFLSYGTSLQLIGGNRVVSYHDAAVNPTMANPMGEGSLKLATCTAACATATPTWAITTVDHSSLNVGTYPSLQIQGGNPIISYRDVINGDLKLATCTADCATATPTWVITTIDSVGNVGRYSDLRFNNGQPVVSYYDVTNGTVKLATCTAGCATATPTWVITTVDSSTAADEGRFSMQLNGDNPVISYHDLSRNALKVATCTAGCATATPTWIINTVEEGSQFLVGQWSSMQLNGGNPVVSYSTADALKLAECTAGCATAAPSWVFTTVDSNASGWMPSLQLKGNQALVTYHEFDDNVLKLAVMRLAAAPVSAGTAVEYFHASFDHYFITDLWDEINALDAGEFVGWFRTGHTFKVLPLATAGASAVCRFFSTAFGPKSSHFYTPLHDECNLVKGNPNWQFEGEVFAIKLSDTAGNCPAGTVALYRSYNNGRGGAPNHRYSTSLDIQNQMLAQGWVPEGFGTVGGVIGCVPS